MRVLTLFGCLSFVVADHWPYRRVIGIPGEIPLDVATRHGAPELTSKPRNEFIHWLRDAVARDSPGGHLKRPFVNNTIPDKLDTFEELYEHLHFPGHPVNQSLPIASTPSHPVPSDAREASQLFSHLGYPIDPVCASDKHKWYFRTTDGACNWMETGHYDYGLTGQKRSRDYNQYSYKDGISQPREGPNARAVSNAFFKRKQRLHYEHTPVLLGLIEFIMHDVTYSEDSTTEYIDVSMPSDEETFPLNTTFRVWRTTAVPGTGTSTSNPRENSNQATTWLDVSSLYGSNTRVARSLRSFNKGKLLTSPGNYLPFNTMGLSMRTRPGVDPTTLFAGGDPRTNEDWIMLAMHTLILRDHNRMCDLLAVQHPEYDDERIYQTVRLAMSAKFMLIANSYQMAYWQTTGNDSMPWPRDDGFPLYRQMYGANALEINPVNLYPWPLVTKDGKPMVASAEMAIVYRFHEFIIPSFPLKDGNNNTIREKDLFESAFDAKGFVEAGLENVLRGIASTDIPNFKSGVDEKFRSAGAYRGSPFDIVTWSIVHEREQGLPTFNQYFRAYNRQNPAVVVPVRKRFEDFSSDPEMVAHLKRLYAHPDDVDLVVGTQLEETNFPGTTVPSSALIISLFSLFGLGNSDRFSVGYSIMRCILVDKPWDCTPSNALDELFWDPRPKELFPRARWLNTFWLTELDVQAHGTNLLWRLITENSGVKCLQKNPLFPYDEKTNPILCTLPKTPPGYAELALTALEAVLALSKQHATAVITAALGLITVLAIIIFHHYHEPGVPPVVWGLPILGVALKFKKDPKALILSAMQKHGGKVFGLKLASLTQFVVHAPEDMQAIVDDAQYEVKFNLHEFFRGINADLITNPSNFETDLHTKLLRGNLGNAQTLAGLVNTACLAAEEFLAKNPLVGRGDKSRHYDDLNDYLTRYITFVMSRCVVGPDSYDDPTLLSSFMKFNDDAVNAMGLASLLPSPLRWIAGLSIKKDFKTIRKVLVPAVQRLRHMTNPADASFSTFVLAAVDIDEHAADLLTIMAWMGLTNLQAGLTSTFFDIVNEPGLQVKIFSSLSNATPANLSAERTAPWGALRSAALESLRLSGPVTGPARAVMEDVRLPSQPALHLPKGQAIALSAFYLHRQPSVWGADATSYRWDRFLAADPPIGSGRFVTWGLQTPHMCPGRWFALQSIQVMVRALLEKWVFVQDVAVSDEEKYAYTSGSVLRKPVGITVQRR